MVHWVLRSLLHSGENLSELGLVEQMERLVGRDDTDTHVGCRQLLLGGGCAQGLHAVLDKLFSAEVIERIKVLLQIGLGRLALGANSHRLVLVEVG